jgi:hypothetical protein
MTNITRITRIRPRHVHNTIFKVPVVAICVCTRVRANVCVCVRVCVCVHLCACDCMASVAHDILAQLRN